MDLKDRIRNVVDGYPTLKQFLRLTIVPPLRGYFRYFPLRLGKSFVWTYFASHLWWLEATVLARTKFGKRMRVNAGDAVGRYVYYFGVWEPNLTEWIRSRLQPGDAFIDVGANVGYYSLLASKLVGERGNVVAIEASPQIFKNLEFNAGLKNNRGANIRCINVAAWDRQELITIFTDPQETSAMTTAVAELAHKLGHAAKIAVPAAPLYELLKPEEVKAARLIKIDVEGAEWRAIRGMAPLLGSCRSDLEISIEISHKMLAVENITFDNIRDFFSQWGFFAYKIENDYSAIRYFDGRPVRAPERITTLSASDQVSDLIFSRKDAKTL